MAPPGRQRRGVFSNPAGAMSRTNVFNRLTSWLFSSTSPSDDPTHTPLPGDEERLPRKKQHKATPEHNIGRSISPSHVSRPSIGQGMSSVNDSFRGAYDQESAGLKQHKLAVEGVHDRATPSTHTKSRSGQAKLIIAFDIGATYSGISYCIHEPGRAPDILGVTKFPAQESVLSDAKVPSLLYYDKNGVVRAAGAEVLSDSTIEVALKEGWVKAEWWKLHLRPKHVSSSVNAEEDLPSLPPGKRAGDILKDFIQYLFQCTKNYIQEHHRAFVWTSFEDSIEYIFTHPNGWESVQQLYRQAIEGAGLIPCTPDGQARVHMLTEGEASLHFCVPNLLGAHLTNQTIAQGVVVIDAGGGTIDLSMFSMTSNPVTCEEIAPAECRLQGSFFVTHRARALLQRKLQGWEYSSEEEISEFAHEFDQSTKLTIKSDQEPAYVRVAGRPYHNSKYSISFGKLKLLGEEATGLFSDSVVAIIDAFEHQQKFLDIPVNVAFLVGGFSSNEWLWSRIQTYFKTKNIMVCRPDDHINKAVANGAVLCHVDPNNHRVSSKVGRLYDMIERAIKSNKKMAKPDMEDVLDAVSSLRKQRQCSDAEIASLRAKLAESAGEIRSLHEVLLVHQQKDHCEDMYSRDCINDAVSLLRSINTTERAVRANESIVNWISEFTTRCLSKLEKIGDDASKENRHDEALKAYSIALSLGHSPPTTVLTKWTSMMLTHDSVDDTFAAAARFQLSKFDILCSICTVLEARGHVMDAIMFFQQMNGKLAKEMSNHGHGKIEQWQSNFQHRCREKLEKLADGAINCKSYGEAVEHLSAILSLNPPNRVDILIKRSKARLTMRSWDEALNDAEEATNLNPSSHLGYEMKHMALHGARRYAEAVEAFDTLLFKIKGSLNADIRKLNLHYIDARDAIRQIVKEIIHPMPRVLIDTSTGRLYNKQQQAAAFETLPIFYELISSMTAKLDESRIREAVKKFYRYVMLSHNWEDGEPLLQQVEDLSIHKLEPSHANIKLQKFCSLVDRLGFRWAWSDTCCIDKLNNVVLQESLVAMFAWYRGSSLTIVYLRGVRSESCTPGGLQGSIWNTRAWTYQEYVAAQIVQFYTEDWEPYLGLTTFNHKDSRDIISEMQQATGVSAQEMAVLRPGLNRVREKLFLASKRRSTLVEDAAYSLLGIFHVAIPVIYGEGNRAVGRFLEHVLTGSGDVAVLAWTGNSGDYNSCLPRDLTVYDRLVPPHIPARIESAEMNGIIAELGSSLPHPSNVRELYKQLKGLPSPSLAAGRLELPGITSTITQLVRISESRDSHSETGQHTYHAKTSIFGDIEIKTAENLTVMEDLCLFHPWIRALLNQEDLRGAATPDVSALALRLVARLRQPFGALLLARVEFSRYRRVAADSLVMAQICEKVLLSSDLVDGICTVEIQ